MALREPHLGQSRRKISTSESRSTSHSSLHTAQQTQRFLELRSGDLSPGSSEKVEDGVVDGSFGAGAFSGSVVPKSDVLSLGEDSGCLDGCGHECPGLSKRKVVRIVCTIRFSKFLNNRIQFRFWTQHSDVSFLEAVHVCVDTDKWSGPWTGLSVLRDLVHSNHEGGLFSAPFTPRASQCVAGSPNNTLTQAVRALWKVRVRDVLRWTKKGPKSVSSDFSVFPDPSLRFDPGDTVLFDHCDPVLEQRLQRFVVGHDEDRLRSRENVSPE